MKGHHIPKLLVPFARVGELLVKGSGVNTTRAEELGRRWRLIEWTSFVAALSMMCGSGVFLVSGWLSPSEGTFDMSALLSAGSLLADLVWVAIPMQVPAYRIEIREQGLRVSAIPLPFWIRPEAIAGVSFSGGCFVRYRRGGMGMRLAVTEATAQEVLITYPVFSRLA